MDDSAMRDHVDQVLAQLEQKLQARRRSKLAMTGSAAGLALALEGCFKTMYGVPEYAAPMYGVEVDAGDAAVQDALGSDLNTLYGIGDAGALDVAVRYGVQCDAGLGDVGSTDLVVRYGVQCDAAADDLGTADVVVRYGVDAG